MWSILVGVFKATVGLLADKARAKAAEKLKDGDVADQKFRNMIVKNIDDMKTKLDGLAKKDLLTSVEIFKTGILSLNQVFEKKAIGEDAASACEELGNDSQEKGTDTSEQAAALSVFKQTQALQLNDLNASAKQSLSDAKQRFQEARLEAIRAFSNEALSVSDRILALNIRLMATILERVDRAADALDECMLCLENLHAMPAVRENLRVHLDGGMKKLVGKEEREAIVLAVCQANHVVFRVMQITSADKSDNKSLPCVDCGIESVDVLRDARMVKLLLKHDMGHLYHGYWSFGQEGGKEQRLKSPHGITTNTCGQLIVVDTFKVIKVYSSRGKFLYSIPPWDQNLDSLFITGAATHCNVNLYVVADYERSQSFFDEPVQEVHQFNGQGQLCQDRYLEPGFKCIAVTVNTNNQIFVLGRKSYRNYYVGVINAKSVKVDRKFGEGILKSPCDICVAGDGSVLVLDFGGSPCVHSFSSEGDHKHQFALQGVEDCSHGSIAFNHTNNTVIASCYHFNKEKNGGVSVYSREGEFVKDIPAFAGKTTIQARQIAVTVDGQIAAVTHKENKICVVES